MAWRRLGFWRRLTVAIVKPSLILLTGRDWRGMEHLPKRGGAILVSNHASHFDPFVLAHFVYDSGRWPRFLAKADLFANPALGWLLRAVRQTPVQRGSVDAAKALEAAVAAIEDGHAVIIYPEVTTTREPDLWPMRGKTGAARLAALTGAPVVPIVVWGAQRVFDPRTRRLRLRPRTPVTVAAGPPLDLSDQLAAGRQAMHEATDTMMLTLRDMLTEVRGEPAPPLWGTTERSQA